jgi:hypothetical protein
MGIGLTGATARPYPQSFLIAGQMPPEWQEKKGAEPAPFEVGSFLGKL